MNRLRALVNGNADGVVDIVRRDGFFFFFFTFDLVSNFGFGESVECLVWSARNFILGSR